MSGSKPSFLLVDAPPSLPVMSLPSSSLDLPLFQSSDLFSETDSTLSCSLDSSAIPVSAHTKTATSESVSIPDLTTDRPSLHRKQEKWRRHSRIKSTNSNDSGLLDTNLRSLRVHASLASMERRVSQVVNADSQVIPPPQSAIVQKEELTSKWDPYTSSEEDSCRPNHEGPSKRKVSRFSMNAFKSAFSRNTKSAPDMPRIENGPPAQAPPLKPPVEGSSTDPASTVLETPNLGNSLHSQDESLKPTDPNRLLAATELTRRGNPAHLTNPRHDSHDDDESSVLPPNQSNMLSLPRPTPASSSAAIRRIPSGSLGPPPSSPTRLRLNRSALFGPPLSPPPSIPLPPTPTSPTHPPTVEALRREKSATTDLTGLQRNPVPLTTSLFPNIQPYSSEYEGRDGAFSKIASERRIMTLGRYTSGFTWEEEEIMSLHSLPPADIPLPPSPTVSFFSSHAGTCKSGEGPESIVGEDRASLRRPSVLSRMRSGSLLNEARLMGVKPVATSIPEIVSPKSKPKLLPPDSQTRDQRGVNPMGRKVFVLHEGARAKYESDAEDDDEVPLAHRQAYVPTDRPRVGRIASIAPREARDSSHSGPNGSVDDTIEPSLLAPVGSRQHSLSSVPTASLPTLVEARRTASHTQIPSLLTTSPANQLIPDSEPPGTAGYTSEVTPNSLSPSESSSDRPVEREKPKLKVSRFWNRKSTLKIQTHSKCSSPEVSPLAKPSSPFLKSPSSSSPSRSFFSNPLGLRSLRSVNQVQVSTPPSPPVPEIVFDPFKAINNGATCVSSLSPSHSPLMSPLIISSFDSPPAPAAGPTYDREAPDTRKDRFRRLSLPSFRSRRANASKNTSPPPPIPAVPPIVVPSPPASPSPPPVPPKPAYLTQSASVQSSLTHERIGRPQYRPPMSDASPSVLAARSRLSPSPVPSRSRDRSKSRSPTRWKSNEEILA